ncbi:MAG: S41 family peptidase [Bacteroidota bacterium]
MKFLKHFVDFLIRQWRICALLLALAAQAGTAPAQLENPAPLSGKEGRLLRFPDIYKDRIVFSYAGDLWIVSSQGGVARRLTSHPGLELFPKFSPDGSKIAFTGQYDGNFNVYVMPSEGGTPKQLTFHPDVAKIPERMGPNNEVITWYPDGKRILFLSRENTFSNWFGRLFSISIEGGLEVQFPLPKGGLTSFSPDGSKIAYNRIFRNFRTWKRYYGGLQQDIFIYDLKTKKEERITDWKGTDTSPMWYKETIYFTSDRDSAHRMNIYAYDIKTRITRQVTHFTDYDVNWPSLGPDAIVFENGGYLYVLDLATEQERKVDVQVLGDFVEAQPQWVDASKFITGFTLSPDGKRALFEARGDIFTVPEKEGNTRDLTKTSGVNEKYPTWSPDGKWIAYFSDRSGEDELYLKPDEEGAQEIRVTLDGKVYRYPPVWSPDSKKLLFADKSLRLYYVDIDTKQVTFVDQDRYWEIQNYGWSPDSKWIVYDKHHDNTFTAIYLYSLDDKKIHPVTTGFTNSRSGVFDPEGKYLYFLSDRNYNAVLGNFDASYSYTKTTGIYVATLQVDSLSPFAPRSDEAAVKTGEGKEKSAGGQKPKTIRLDLEGIDKRVVNVPIKPGNIRSLNAARGRIYYITAPTMGLSGNASGEEPALHCYDFVERKETTLLSPVDAYDLSADGNKIIYKSGKTFGIIDSKPQSYKVGDGALNLDFMKMRVDPREEWREMFDQAWRLERDFFYSPAMNGIDWEATRKKYEVLLPHVLDRYDLTYVIGEMIGELGNSHTYVGGGAMPDLHPVNVGMLGVDFALDPESGYYRFAKIYPGENFKENRRSPLTEPGIDVKEGEYLLAVNGAPVKAPANPYSFFVNTVGQTVTLTVNTKATTEGSRKVIVKPIESEFGLRYLSWVTSNREKVDSLSGGKIGYIYLPDMSADGLNAFVEQYYPQIRKEGLIIDVRYNGGGFVDEMILERLRRILVGMSMSRNGANETIPEQVFYGYMACLINGYSASDGDIFPYYFRKYGLGPLIGERTWGGVRGIRGYRPLVDGGYVTVPEFSIYGLRSEWIIENHGVDPDIVVDESPTLVMEGHDPQLEKAVEVLLKEIREHPKVLPPRPPYLPPYPEEQR